MIKIRIDGKEFTLGPGDSIDLNEKGFIMYYDEPDASAIRILNKSNQDRVNNAIDFVKKKHGITAT